LTVIHANFGGASASPPFKSSLSVAPEGLTVSEILQRTTEMMQGVVADRATMSDKARLDLAEEFVQAAIRNWAFGGLTHMRIATAQIQAATLLGAPN